MAQIKDFYIEKIESASELLDLLCDPAKYAERLKALTDYQDAINVRLKRWADFDDVDKYKAKVEALMVEAKQQKEEADKYAAQTRKEATTTLENAKTGAALTRAQLTARSHALDKREKEVDTAENESIERAAKAAADLASAQKMETYSKGILAEAHEIKKEYEEKLAKLRGIAA